MTPALFARWTKAPLFGITAAILALTGPPEPIAAQTLLLPGGSTEVVLAGNEFQCNIDHEAGLCHARGPFDPGAVWPTGSPNGYIFNSGIMVAALIGAGGGPWARDTVASLFFNVNGGTTAAPITNVWNSLDPEHNAAWPDAGDIAPFPFLNAHVDDPDLFADVLLGRVAASQQDSWSVYWDGDPRRTGGRPHPMGLIVEQRTLAWNYPAGNEGTLYVIYELTNVSNSPYFQQLQEGFRRPFGEEPPVPPLPDAGWTLEDVYVAYGADADVTANAGGNMATAILPFDMTIFYDGDFVASEFRYPLAIFHAPFFTNAPGILGTKLLATPDDRGLTMFAAGTDNQDPAGSASFYRFFAGANDPSLGDESCYVPDPRRRRICFMESAPRDLHHYQVSGPFDLAPGETVVFALALFAAATVEQNPAGPTVTPGIQNPPSLTLEPAATPSLHPGCHGDPITNIERAAGWIATTSCPAEGSKLDMFDVDVIPESLLHKAQVAQALFDSRFLLPAAPEPPQFEVVPGDDQVTITWQPSATEDDGDPFAAPAADPSHPLANPNFRADDIEGYRIYRSSDGINFTLVAQFDRAGTTFVDALCETEPDHFPGTPCATEDELPLTGRIVQYPRGVVVELADGSALVLDADTTPGRGFPPLEDTGIPYTFVDSDVRNGFEYFYRVTAFDVNSLSSGPGSLESASLAPQAVVPAPITSADGDLRRIRVAPDPYYAASHYDLGPADRSLRFFNVPPQATIRIYTTSGILVDVIGHDDPVGGVATWDMRNRTGLMIASGVYFYHVTTPDGREHIGRFTVVHSGLSR
ncbi:MAG TPA: hypothetical protein VF039_01985 [Longimicrobiales bacterium]